MVAGLCPARTGQSPVPTHTVVGDDKTHTLRRVARGFQRAHTNHADLHFEAVAQSDMRKIRRSLRSDVNLRACAHGQFFVPRNEVGMEMRFKNMTDLQALLFGGFQIDVDVALRIDDGGFAFRSEHVGRMCQAIQVKLLKIHLRLRWGTGIQASLSLSFSQYQSSMGRCLGWETFTTKNKRNTEYGLSLAVCSRFCTGRSQTGKNVLGNFLTRESGKYLGFSTRSWLGDGIPNLAPKALTGL